MLNSEFNLYNREWLSLVFNNRNQQYGAYELRRSYSNVLTKAMGATFLTVAALCITETVISRNRSSVEEPHVTIIATTPPEKIFEAKLQKEQPKPKQAQQKTEAPKQLPKAVPQVSMQNLNYVVKPDDQVKKDPEPVKEDIASGPVDKVVPGGGAENVPVIDEGGTKEGVPGGNGESIVNIGDGLQVMPEPVGGDKAWAKFLQKNLRFPAQAQDAGVSGKVYLSFIIEKDGHLSNISVERKAGYGFDEEASRVLKLAPAWKPGMQNGQPVRVRYMIPINFQLTEQ